MAKRYIDADSIPFFLHKGWDLFIADKQDIAKMPTADVVEVKHGEWIDDGDCFYCSVCDKPYALGSLQTIYDVRRCWKYCASCGAKMDRGKTE